jgi:hypothetical protein
MEKIIGTEFPEEERNRCSSWKLVQKNVITNIEKVKGV